MEDSIFGNRSLKSRKLDKVIPQTASTVSLREVVDGMCFNINQSISNSLEHLPRLAVHASRESLIKALIASRSTLQRLCSICEWSSFGDETHALLNVLNEKDSTTKMIETADKLAFWYQNIQQAPLPAFDIQRAIRIHLGMMDPNMIQNPTAAPSNVDQDRWISQLNDLIRLRLVQHHIPFVLIEKGEAIISIHSVNIKISIVPDDNWFITEADSNALCSLLQTHFNYMPTSDDTFRAKLESLMDEYLMLWILDRFSTEAAKVALVVKQREKYLEIIYNPDSSIRITKQASSMLSVIVLDDVINVPFVPSFDADIKTTLHEAMETISNHFHSLLESILTPFGFIQVH